MKKRSYLIAAGCTVVLYALSACSDHAANDTAQAGNPETMSVAEARRYFERVAAPTRAGGEEGTLTLGTYMPDWSLATVSAGEVLSSTDVPVRGEFRYFRYRIDEYGEPRFTPIYHKLVVVKDSRSGVMSSYLRFYVPDPDYAAGRTADDYDRLLNSGSKGDFTGLAVYTSLDGFPVHAVRYAGGACQAEAFLYDKSRTQAENTARLGEMLDGLSVVCSRETAVTRAEAESEKSEPVDGGGIEAVVVSAKRPVNHIKYERSDTDPVKPTEEDRGPSGSGGGGGGASSNPGSPANTRYRENENIMLASDSREKLEPLLDSLRQDCMAGKIIGSIRGNVTIRTGFFGSSVMIPTAYTFEGGTVWDDFEIRMGSRLDDITLLEELFHTHQCSGKTPEEYRGMRLNNEIEAKLCWYMYRLKIGNMNGVSKYISEGEGRRIFGTLSKYIMAGNIKSDNFREEYRNAASLLRSMSRSYADVTLYPFSEDAVNVDVLMKMMEDCPGYKNE